MGRVPLTKCYQMLQNARVIAFTVSSLLRENRRGGYGGCAGGGGTITPRDPDYGKRNLVLSSDLVPFVHLFRFDFFVLCCKSSYFFPF